MLTYHETQYFGYILEILAKFENLFLIVCKKCLGLLSRAPLYTVLHAT